MKKNEILELQIEDIGTSGEGIGKADGYTVFVDGALPAERVKVLLMKAKKNYGYGKLLEILDASAYRTVPACPVAARCGGCQLQHMTYEAQLAFKTKKVKDCLERIGKVKDVQVYPALGMEDPFRYRNKAQFPVGEKDGTVQIGFFAKHSHRIVDTEVCLLQHTVNDAIVREVRAFLEEYRIPPYQEQNHTGLIRHILTRVACHTGEVMVCLVINGKKIPHIEKLVERLQKIEGVCSVVLNENREQTNVILGNQTKTIWGKDRITESLHGMQFEISPLSFYQVNAKQMEVLYDCALRMAQLKGNETVLDLYCGIGTISLYFAQKAKHVLGVEIVPQAIADAKENAKKNGVENVRFLVGAAEEVIPNLYRTEGLRADVVVVDPPRKGCDLKLLETIVSIQPQKLVYVSCDPATLARDICYLRSNGFALQQVQPVDMFPMSTHVECVALMTWEMPEHHAL